MTSQTYGKIPTSPTATPYYKTCSDGHQGLPYEWWWAILTKSGSCATGWVQCTATKNLDPKTAVHFLDSSQHYWPRKIYGQMLEVIVKRVFEAEFLIYNVFKSYRGFFLMIYKFSAKKGSLVRCILWLQFLHLGLMLHKWIEGKVCLHRFSVTNFLLALCPLCLHCEWPQIQQIALGQCCSHNASTWLPNLARGRTRDCTSPLHCASLSAETIQTLMLVKQQLHLPCTTIDELLCNWPLFWTQCPYIIILLLPTLLIAAVEY